MPFLAIDLVNAKLMLFGLALVLMMLLRPEGSSRARSARPSCSAARSARRLGERRQGLGTAMAQVILEARKVTRRFGGLVAVSDVDFSIEEKSIVSLIGPNGAGKTTFFNPNRPASTSRPPGEITFKGQRLDTIAPHRSPAWGSHGRSRTSVCSRR